MSANHFPLRLPPLHLLACPKCQANCEQGFSPREQKCLRCGQVYFDLAGMPCWFANGVQQKSLWNIQLGLTLQAAAQKLSHYQQLKNRPDILPSLCERLNEIELGLQQVYLSIAQLMAQAGLDGQIDPELAEHCPNNLLHFLDLLLRDWAWDMAPSQPQINSENNQGFNRIERALAASGGSDNVGDLLVLGAGAGRLSWDIHRLIKPATTLALDINPLLAIAAHHLVALQKPLALTELPADLQANLPLQHYWQLQVPDLNSSSAQNWFFIAADAWACPLQAHSFDVIVTPWFIDVNGADLRNLLALISRLLKPGGRWINSGPLLYSKHLVPEQRYSHEEIVELAGMAGFNLYHQELENTEFLNSPLLAKGRREQVWTFAAEAPPADFINTAASFPPPWLLLPHLPIPQTIAADAQGQPVLIHLLSLLNNHLSLNDLAGQMAANLSPGEDALALITSVFAQMLTATVD